MLDGGRQRCNSDLEGSTATGLRWQRHGADVLRSSRTEGPWLRFSGLRDTLIRRKMPLPGPESAHRRNGRAWSVLHLRGWPRQFCAVKPGPLEATAAVCSDFRVRRGAITVCDGYFLRNSGIVLRITGNRVCVFAAQLFDTLFGTIKHPKPDALALSHGALPMPQVCP